MHSWRFGQHASTGQYAVGYAAPSFGLNCAHMAGMRADIIERAAQACAQQELLFIETLPHQLLCHCHVVICKRSGVT